MPAAPAVRVEGYTELMRAFRGVDRATSRGVRADMRQTARPVAVTAEELATREIPNIGKKWPKMRVGVTTRVVYVAPRQKGVKRRGDQPRRRPNLADLLMGRAMQPSLELHRPHFESSVARTMDRIADRFNSGGVPR